MSSRIDRVFASEAGSGGASDAEAAETAASKADTSGAFAMSTGGAIAIASIPPSDLPPTHAPAAHGWWWRIQEGLRVFGPGIQTLFTATVGIALAWWLTGRVELAMKQRELELSHIQEMHSGFARLMSDSTTQAGARADAFALAPFRDYAIIPLIVSIESGNEYRWRAGEDGLRAIAMTDSAPVARQLIRVLGNRSRLYSWRTHDSAIRILGDLGCIEALPTLLAYRTAVVDLNVDSLTWHLQRRASGASAPSSANAQELARDLEDAILSVQATAQGARTSWVEKAHDAATHFLDLLGPANAEASNLPSCTKVGMSEYHLRIDGIVADAMDGQAIGDQTAKLIAQRLAGDIESITHCWKRPPQKCPAAPPDPVTCSARRPKGPSDFDAQEFRALDGGNVLVESWVGLTPDKDDDGNDITRVRIQYALVPLALPDRAASGVSPFLAFDQVIPNHCSRSAVKDSVAQGPELRGIAFLCDAIKLLPHYDAAWEYLMQARGAFLSVSRPARREQLEPLMEYSDSLAHEIVKLARADTHNSSSLSAMSDDQVKLALEVP